jgi:hypothetical protein
MCFRVERQPLEHQLLPHSTLAFTGNNTQMFDITVILGTYTLNVRDVFPCQISRPRARGTSHQYFMIKTSGASFWRCFGYEQDLICYKRIICHGRRTVGAASLASCVDSLSIRISEAEEHPSAGNSKTKHATLITPAENLY